MKALRALRPSLRPLHSRSFSISRRMSSQLGMASSPFTKAVVSSMRKLYPEVLADKSFDNTGLILEAPFDHLRRQMNSVLLTIDLTTAVADEAIENNHSIVVAYHTIIFRGLKSLTFADTQQASLLRLANEGISVYCPHTAVDAHPDGNANWLCDIVTGKLDTNPEPETHTAAEGDESMPPVEDGEREDNEEEETRAEKNGEEDSGEETAKEDCNKSKSRPSMQRAYSKPTYPTPTSVQSTDLTPSTIPHKRTVITPCSPSVLDAANALNFSTTETTYTASNTGYGRLITFSAPQPLTSLIERIARGVGTPKGFPVAIPQNTAVEDLQISTVGICAGAGESVLSGCAAMGPGGLLFTGELPHHAALAATEKGGCVVSLFHSNSERGYLHSVLKGRLERELREEWGRVRGEEEGGEEGGEMEDVLGDAEVRVEVSERDRDPFGIVMLQGSEMVGTKI